MIEEKVVDNKIDITYIPITDIHEDNEFNCRGKVVPFDVKELAANIKEVGLRLPLEVRTYNEERRARTGYHYGLVAGYRRLASLKSLGYTEAPCIIKGEMNDTEARLRNLGENIIREDLNILQEAKSLEKLKIAGLNAEYIAKRLNKSRAWVDIRFKLLDFPPDIQEDFGSGKLGQQFIQQLASLPRNKLYEQVKLLKNKKLAGEKGISVRRPTSMNSKRARNRGEMSRMLDHIYENLGPNSQSWPEHRLATRVLAWATGNIGSKELFMDIKKIMDTNNEQYDIPEEEL